MSNNYEPGSGASIKPSPRRSIHSHCRDCPLAMGTHGMYSSASAGGRDEPDNVMSKHAKVTMNKNSVPRRKSLSTSTDESSHEKVRKMLSRSLPVFPSKSYSSDTHGSWTDDQSPSGSSPLNTSSQRSTNNSNVSQMSRNGTHGISRGRSVPRCTESEDSKGTATVWLGLSLIVAVGSIAAYCGKDLFGTIEELTKNTYYNGAQFADDLLDIRKKYKISDDSILKLKAGISTISQKADTGSFIFVYNSKAFSFDPVDFNNFMRAVSSTASKYLRNDSTLADYIAVDGSTLRMKMRSHGELISRYHDDVIRTGVLLVEHLEEVPASLAMAFHYYCDEYNPVAKKSAILFTLDIAKCHGISDQAPPTHARIEKCLAGKWSKLPADNISPLLTRVVDIVVDVTRS